MGGQHSKTRIRGIDVMDIRLTLITSKMNIIKLKIGGPVIIPLYLLNSNTSELSTNIINDACKLDKTLDELGVICNNIYKDDLQGYVASFIIHEFYNKRTKILELQKGTSIVTRKDEERLWKHQQTVCNRIWMDLDEYYQMLSNIVSKKINGLLLNKNINGKHEIKVTADYFSSGEDGRYLFELGNYAIKFPLLKSMILNRLTQESKHTRIVFKELKIKEVSNKQIEKGMKFTVTIKIKLKK